MARFCLGKAYDGSKTYLVEKKYSLRDFFLVLDLHRNNNWGSCRRISGQKVETLVFNRPFYRYGGHIELIRLKEYYRMPRGHEHISFVFLSAFRDIFS